MKKQTALRTKLRRMYHLLYSHFGWQRWWPAHTKFEVIVGAILTQNTSWKNVERAIGNLKKHKVLTPHALHIISNRKCATLIKPAGYFNVKTKRLKNLITYLIMHYNGSLKSMFAQKVYRLRRELLIINGIGKETADSILLYAGEKALFVVDAYTRRILLRHHFINEKDTYDTIQNLFMKNLPRQVPLFNDFHAQIVRCGNVYCKRIPRCGQCPLSCL